MKFEIPQLIRENKIEVLDKLFDQNPELLNVEFRGGYNRATPLHYAVEKGNAEMVKFLVDRGANLGAKLQLNYNRCHKKFRSYEKNYQGPTPLELAVALKKYDKVAILVNYMEQITPTVLANITKYFEDIYSDVVRDGTVSTEVFKKILAIHEVMQKAKGVDDILTKIGEIEYKYLEQKSDKHKESLKLQLETLSTPISNILSFFKATDINSLDQAYELNDPFTPFTRPSHRDLIGQDEKVVDSSLEAAGGGEG